MAIERNGVYLWVEGSPQAAENPPHDARWRASIASEVRTSRTCPEIGLDFELEPARVRIDLDNLVRLALDGLRDAGPVAAGGRSIERLAATKRSGPKIGLGVGLVWTPDVATPEPFPDGPDLDVTWDRLPREGRTDDTLAWRDHVAAAWGMAPVEGPVGIEITTTSPVSLPGLLKPVIDGLEAYLGRKPKGAGRLRPRDEQVTWLKAVRVASGPVLRLRVGPAPLPAAGRTKVSYPYLPPSDPDFSMDYDVVVALERVHVWGKIWS